VWGGICSRGKTDLFFIEGKLNSTKYQELLEETLLPAAERLYEDGDWKLMQDHATCHDSKSTQDWLGAHVPDFFDKESWPAKSPDINIIESLWSQMENNINREELKSADDFKNAILQEWESLDLSTLEKLVESMPRRRQAVMKAKGWHTKY
jgi:hypothetical protein